MHSFHAIKAHILTYSDTLTALDPPLVNGLLVQCAIKQLVEFQQSLSALELHPFKVEKITDQDHKEVLAKIDKIVDLFCNHIGFNGDVITISNTAYFTQEIINNLIAHSQIGQLQSLSTLAAKLKQTTAAASASISLQVQSYKEGPLTIASVQEAVSVLSDALNSLSKELTSLSTKLRRLANITRDWISLKKELPVDFVQKIETDVRDLYDILAQVSHSLVYEAEKMLPAFQQLNYPIEAHDRPPQNSSYCAHAHHILNHFQKMDSLKQQIEQRMGDQNPSGAILLYNVYRLREMIGEGNKLLDQLPQTVVDALKKVQQKTPQIEFFAQIVDDPAIDPKAQLLRKILCDDFYSEIGRLEYTKTHIDELKKHPLFLSAQQGLERIQRHLATLPFFQGETFSSPFTIESDFWLLKSLKISSMQDAETLYFILAKQAREFLALRSIFVGKSNENGRKTRRGPWPSLVELEELIRELPKT